MKTATTLLVLLLLSGTANAQGTPGVLRCAFNGGLDIHATRETNSPVVARIPCGAPILLIDQRFGSPHVRTEDGKDGYIIGLNLGQWSVEPEGTQTAVPAQSVITQPATPVSVAAAPQLQPLRSAQPTQQIDLDGEAPNAFRRFDIGYILYSFLHQGDANMHGGELTFVVHATPSIGFLAEGSAHRVTDGIAQADLYTYRFGPRFSQRVGDRVTLFEQVLFGGARLKGSASAVVDGVRVSGAASIDGISGYAGGGVDLGIKPWFAVRVIEGGYSLFHETDYVGASHGFRIGAGLVFRFGRN